MFKLSSDFITIFEVIRLLEKRGKKATFAHVRDYGNFLTSEEAQAVVDEMVADGFIRYNDILKRYEITQVGQPLADNEVPVEVVLTQHTRRVYLPQTYNNKAQELTHISDEMANQIRANFLKLKEFKEVVGVGEITRDENGVSVVKVELKFGTLFYTSSDVIKIEVDTRAILLKEFIEIINEDCYCMFGDDDAYRVEGNTLVIEDAQLCLDFKTLSALLAH